MAKNMEKKMVVGDGFEPSKHSAADLQSMNFDLKNIIMGIFWGFLLLSTFFFCILVYINL